MMWPGREAARGCGLPWGTRGAPHDLPAWPSIGVGWGPCAGRTIGGCRCGGAAPPTAAFCAAAGGAFRGAHSAAAGAARGGAAGGARSAGADGAAGEACHAARSVARNAADRPPAADRPNGRVAAPEPDLGWTSGGVATRSAVRRALEFAGARRSRDAGAAGVATRRTTEFMTAIGGVRAAPAAAAARPAARRTAASPPAGPPRRRPPARRRVARTAPPCGPRRRCRRRPRWPRVAAADAPADPPGFRGAERRRPATADAAPRPAARRPRGRASPGHRTGGRARNLP
jgi:hypothetical protein